MQQPTAKDARLMAILEALPYDRLTPLTGILDLDTALRLYPNRFFGHPVPCWGQIRADVVELCSDGLVGYIDSPWGRITARGRDGVRFYYKVGERDAA